MIQSRWPSLLLAIVLLLAGGAIIVYISLTDPSTVLSMSVPLLIALFGLSLTTFAALTLILREVAIRLRHESIYMARQETLSEHRRFLRRLDHELKNPIMALRAGLGSMLLIASDSQKEIVQMLDGEVVRLSHLVGDLRKLAEMDVGQLEVHPIRLADAIQEIVALDEDRLVAQNRHFIVDSDIQDIEEITFMGDQNLLLLAVHNLLDNALKYSSPDDTITLQTTIDDGQLIIRVKDTGFGIRPDDLELVWEELYRGESKPSVPGYGIGLALVKSIIEYHDGEVALESEFDTGTTVTLCIPLR